MNLERIRKARGLSLQSLAEMIGMDTSTVQRAEKMHHTAKLETYRKCADALGVTLADLFTDSADPVERELVAAYRLMTDDQRQMLRGIVDAAKAPAQPSAR